MYRDLSDGKDAGYLMPVYLRSLTQLEVSLESESFVEQLQTLVDKIEKVSLLSAALYIFMFL